MLETSHDQDRLSFSPPEAPPSDIEMSSDNKDEMEGDAEMQVDIETSSGQENGTVNNYAVDILTLGLLWHGFKDATKEGDGDQIIHYYNFLLPIYRSMQHRNDCVEAFRLLVQTMILSPRKVAEIKWNRTINVHSKRGKIYQLTSIWNI